LKVGTLVKVKSKYFGDIIGIVVRTWHDDIEQVYDVRNIRSGKLTVAAAYDIEVIS
jgi:hypothetical protein